MPPSRPLWSFDVPPSSISQTAAIQSPVPLAHDLSIARCQHVGFPWWCCIRGADIGPAHACRHTVHSACSEQARCAALVSTANNALHTQTHVESCCAAGALHYLLQVKLSEDVNGAANKLIVLKSEFPKADVFSIMASRPKTLLQPEELLLDNAKKVRSSRQCYQQGHHLISSLLSLRRNLAAVAIQPVRQVTLLR